MEKPTRSHMKAPSSPMRIVSQPSIGNGGAVTGDFYSVQTKPHMRNHMPNIQKISNETNRKFCVLRISLTKVHAKYIRVSAKS